MPTDIDGVETFYQCCSNGEASNCGQCLEMVCDFMTDHNKAAQSAQNLSDAINQFAEQKSEQHETVKTEEPV